MDPGRADALPRARFSALSFAATARCPSALKEELHASLDGRAVAIAQPAAVEKLKTQLPAAPFATDTFAQVSRNPTVRLKTSRPAAESGSRQK